MLKRCFKPKYARLDPNYDLILRFFYFESLCVRQFFEKSAICFVYFWDFRSRSTKRRLGSIEVFLKTILKPSLFCFLKPKGWHEEFSKPLNYLSDESWGVLSLNIISCLHVYTFIRCFQNFRAARKNNINGGFPI